MPVERIKVFKERTGLKQKRVKCTSDASVEVTITISEAGFLDVNNYLESSSDDDVVEEKEESTQKVKRKLNRFFEKELPQLAKAEVRAKFVDEFEYRCQPHSNSSHTK